MQPHDIRQFEEARPGLLGLAYRILGTLADAEDAVQDTWLKWAAADRDVIEKPAAWLTTTCTRRCLDLLRSAHRSRTDYVGAWLPEPIQTPVEASAEEAMVLASSLSTAFLMMLERLTPKERAAYLLHDIFERSYAETAEAIGVGEPACRKLVSRARSNVEQAQVRAVTPGERQDALLTAFQAAVTSGETEPLAALLTDDIRLTADGGGKVPAARDVLRGKERVLTFVIRTLHAFWTDFGWEPVMLNGTRGFRLTHTGNTVATVSFAYDEAGRATDVYIMRNPDKLARLEPVVVH